MSLRRVLAVSLAVVGVAGAGACNPFVNHYADDDATVTQPVRAVDLRNAAGSVTVHAGGPGTAISIHRRVEYHSDQKPALSQDVRDGTLTLDGCGDCGIEYVLTVPASVSLTIANKAGSVSLDGMSGPLDVTAGAGEVNGTGLGSPSVKVRDSAGAVDLTFSAAPTSVDVHDKAGSVHVAVPAGRYHVITKTDSSEPHVSVPDDPSAAATLTLTADAGGLTVSPTGSVS